MESKLRSQRRSVALLLMTLLAACMQNARGFLQTTKTVPKYAALSNAFWKETRQAKPSGFPKLSPLTSSTRPSSVPLSMVTNPGVSGETEEDIEKRIAVKGDQIRQLKADGISKEDLGPHIEELLALKALANPTEEAKKKDSKNKGVNANSGKTGGKDGGGEASESEIRQARLDKANAMVEAGQNPYAYSFDPTHTAAELKIIYDGKLEGGEEDENADVKVAGRIMTRRVFGKLAFFTLLDESGTIQLQLDKKRLGPSFKVNDSAYLIVLCSCVCVFFCFRGRVLTFRTICY